MAKYALVNPANEIIEFRDYAEPPIAVTESATKPRLLPVILQDVTFDTITEVREGPTFTVSATQVTEAYTKRTKTPAEIEAMRAAKISIINFEADRHLILTMQQQIRSLTRLLNLLFRHTDVTGWPQAQQDAVTTHLARLDTIDAVRAIEDIKVAEVNALTTPQQIAAYDAAAGW